MRLPLNGSPRITTLHGTPGWGRFGRHMGIDFAVPVGTPVFAPDNGQVTASYRAGSGNQIIEIRIGKYLHRFLHNSKRLVKTGEWVSKGELIAKSGNTGQTTGPHLHWDVRKDGTTWSASASNYIDPLTLIKENPVKTKVTKAMLDLLYLIILGRQQRGSEGYDVYLDKNLWQVILWLWNSDEAKDRRNLISSLKSQVAKLKDKLAGRETNEALLKKKIDAQEKTIKELQTKVDAKAKELEQADDRNADLSIQLANAKDQIAMNDRVIRNQAKEIDRLEAELAATSQDTAQLNALGKAIKWLLVRWGITK